MYYLMKWIGTPENEKKPFPYIPFKWYKYIAFSENLSPMN